MNIAQDLTNTLRREMSPPGYRTAWRRLREIVSCKVCLRVAGAVFLLIVVVESLILIPSALRFRDQEWLRWAELARATVELPLGVYGKGPMLGDRLALALGHHKLTGVTVLNAAGETVAQVGEQADVRRGETAIVENGIGIRGAGVSRIDAIWSAGAGAEALTVAVRIDAEEAASNLLAYVLRIGALVGLIVVFVTVGTMVVLHFTLLQPLLRLRTSMLGASANPDAAERFAVPTRRDDEIGEAIRAHNELLSRVAASKRRDREIAQERARFSSRHEILTGFPNRAALLEHFGRLRDAASEAGARVAIFLLNIAEFRVINSRYGTAFGDQVLLAIAGEVRRVATAADFVAHLGADRFAVVRTGVGSIADDACFAESLLRKVGCKLECSGVELVLAARVGVAIADGGPLNGAELLSHADLALDRAREDGGYRFFAAEDARAAHERQELKRDLEQGLGRGELYIAYQPKFAVLGRNGPVLSGAEALLRWRHPTRGMVSPGVFVPIAESTGLSASLGEFVLGEVCRQMQQWKGRFGVSPRVAVNVSANEFADGVLPERWHQAVRAANLSAGQLELEMTESVAMKDVDRTIAAIRRLNGFGVDVSIDDFGTGYSSLAYLRKFAVKAIKIDKSFVDDIGTDRNAEAICSAILRLGQSLGTRIIAEGVENERQLEFLRRRRCDEVQGYLLGKPVPGQEFERCYLATLVA